MGYGYNGTKNLVPGKFFPFSQKEEFFKILKEKAGDKEILPHGFCSITNFYAGTYDSDNRIGQCVDMVGYYLYEEENEEETK